MVVIYIAIFLLLLTTPCYADWSIAGKTGYVMFDESRTSEFPGNNVYDNEMSYGGFIRYDENDWIFRVDYDHIETGGEVEFHLPIAYEGLDLRQDALLIGIGRYYRHFYLVTHMGWCFYDLEVEKYAPYPFKEGISGSPAVGLTLGYEVPIKPLFLFIEGRYLWTKPSVYVNDNKVFETNASNLGVFGGLGVRF